MGLAKQSLWWLWCGKMAASSCVHGGARLASGHLWPAVCRVLTKCLMLVSAAVAHWWDCTLVGLWSLCKLGLSAIFIVLWSCYLHLTSPTSLAHALLSVVSARVAIRYFGYTPGLIIVALFFILLMWTYGHFWITGFVLIAGGYLFSHKHARFFTLVLMAYAVFYLLDCHGWRGILFMLNLSFLSGELFNRLIEGFESCKQDVQLEEPEKEPEPVVEDFFKPYEYPSPPLGTPTEAETFEPSVEPLCSASAPMQSMLCIGSEASTNKVVNVDTSSCDEMKRIMDGTTHYDVLGILRHRAVDPKMLKKEYHKKVLLVHPDKNMGNPLACESFKKLQCAYEVLSDTMKKSSYDEQLRKEENRKILQRSRDAQQHNGLEFLPEESRRIECTKCSNFHVWVCTRRAKTEARWCQRCLLYHHAKDGDGWVENCCSPLFGPAQKVDIPRAFVCAEGKIFDVSEWAICQGMVCKPNMHRPTFMVNMVRLDRRSVRSGGSSSSRYPWSLDAQMISDDTEFDRWFQQAFESGVFSESPKRRKSWPFKINQKFQSRQQRSP